MDILLGCGAIWERRLECDRDGWNDLVTVDIDKSKNPTLVWDLNKIPLPFDDNSADEIHAYHVLEHIGTQGDWRFFFDQFTDFWRILKPGGYFCGITPMWNNMWAWSDPGHTRVISKGSLVFLSQKQYKMQIGLTTMTDYREYYKADFDTVFEQQAGGDFGFILKAVKE